ncbi:hypothetical protein L226DRAFT_105193 [Lentinus tigrinus ALCF2SS1-7]|uniref:uncharacterized protein n=1 Tax=Lentinus tigrinus ALCF2SS1-7 TaxID=1328758 RepID=UPI0011660580|nr:hypothetical protein L226DRAFT_105193 [Lentinus tigrinus ALCF2SS1-7]
MIFAAAARVLEVLGESSASEGVSRMPHGSVGLTWSRSERMGQPRIATSALTMAVEGRYRSLVFATSWKDGGHGVECVWTREEDVDVAEVWGMTVLYGIGEQVGSVTRGR